LTNFISRPKAKGALLDEYERAIEELKKVVVVISDHELLMIVDPDTSDEDCRSFQTILSHVVHSGYGYATNIHNLKGYPMTRPEKVFHRTVSEYISDLDRLFLFTENVFRDLAESDLEQLDNSLKIKTKWGQVYDTEQMMEHAIVHILRHRRQIEKFILVVHS
jgi:uncharacterized damage-inducible protein DinB